jgi:hypothetical protein
VVASNQKEGVSMLAAAAAAAAAAAVTACTPPINTAYCTRSTTCTTPSIATSTTLIASSRCVQDSFAPEANKRPAVFGHDLRGHTGRE